MKRISKVLILWGMLAVLTACGQEASSAGNLAQDINIGSGSRENAGKGRQGEKEGAEQASEELKQDTDKEKESVFGFLYEGVNLIPGEVFDRSALEGYTEVSEVPSCAFDGNDNVYNYGVFELTTYIEEEGERVYSIYFMDSNLTTTEGLCLGDTVEDMKSLYGEDYAAEGTAYTYTRGETLLTVIAKDDIVVSIEYRLDR